MDGHMDRRMNGTEYFYAPLQLSLIGDNKQLGDTLVSEWRALGLSTSQK